MKAFEMKPVGTEDTAKPLNQKLLTKQDTYTDARNDDDYYARGNTFSRTFTFTDNLKRTMTQTLGIDADLDEKWTNNIAETFNKASVQKDGDIPEPAAYGRDKEFWVNFIVTGLVGCLLGLIGICYLNITEKAPKWWVNNFYAPDTSVTFFHCDETCNFAEQKTDPSCICDKYKNFDEYAGEKYWVGIIAFTGFIVGCIRHFTKYPDDLPGIFKEILDYHVHWEWSFLTFVISTISLSGGACLGPEQALGNVGGGIASYISEKWIHFKDESNRKLFVLGGIACALGALMPSPLLAVLLIHELGELPKSFMECTLVMSIGAVMAYMVYQSLIEYTWVEKLQLQTAFVSYDWTYEEVDCMTAIVIGMVSAGLGLCCLIIIGFTKQLLNRIRMRLAPFPVAKSVIPPTLAGILIGLVNWTLPMTVGNGSQTMPMIVSYGLKGQLKESILIKSAFAKMFCLGLSMNSGFVGGFVYPIMTIGAMAGVVANIKYPELPIGLTCGCFIAAVPCSICPIPFTFVIMMGMIFYFGAYQAAPIFIACITSYTLVVGSGIFNALRRRAAGQPTVDPNEAKVMTNAERLKKEQENFAVEQYMSTQKAGNRGTAI